MGNEIFDLVVVGAGPGGYTAAIRGAQSGLKVALIDRSDPGGCCLHRGCIPSKALVAAAEVVALANKGRKRGISFSSPKIDFPELIRSKDATVAQLAGGLRELFKAHKIDYREGEATLLSPTEVEVRGKGVVRAKNVIVATGSEPIRPSLFPFDGKRVVTTDELFQIKELPASLLVVGGGVIGCEMASAFNLLGSEVSIVELLPNLLSGATGAPGAERMVSRTLRKLFEGRGIDVLTESRVEECHQTGKGVAVKLSGGTELEVELLLVAIGRQVGKDSLGLDRIGLNRLGIRRNEKGFVQVNSQMESGIPGLYVIGDLVGKTMLAHGAAEEGISAVENILGHKVSMDYEAIPRVAYTTPEIASIGKGEEELKAAKIPFKTGRFSYSANAMALLHEEREGFALIHVGEDQRVIDPRVLGGTILGERASELIQEVALVMKNRLPVSALTGTIHAHPTFSEILHEAALDSQGMAIHKFSRK